MSPLHALLPAEKDYILLQINQEDTAAQIFITASGKTITGRDPVNLGPVINTKGNEAYPFINGAGRIFLFL